MGDHEGLKLSHDSLCVVWMSTGRVVHEAWCVRDTISEVQSLVQSAHIGDLARSTTYINSGISQGPSIRLILTNY